MLPERNIGWNWLDEDCISYINLTPLTAVEIEEGQTVGERLWLRGGFPDSYLADSDRLQVSIQTVTR